MLRRLFLFRDTNQALELLDCKKQEVQLKWQGNKQEEPCRIILKVRIITTCSWLFTGTEKEVPCVSCLFIHPVQPQE